MCIISSQRDTYCYESKNDSSTNRSTWSEGLNIEIKIITPNYFKARCKTMTASWRGLRRIDNSELSTTLNSCFNMASLSRLIWQLIVYAIATSKGQLGQFKDDEKMARPVTQGIPQNLIIHSANPRCLSVRWWSYIRLQRHASYSHSTLRGREGLATRRHRQWEKAYMQEMFSDKTMVQAEIRNVEE